MAGARSPWLFGRRRSRRKGPPTPSPPPLAEESNTLPPGTEVEVRIDDEGFYGSWYEATVVGFDPAAGRGCPAQYTVTYSHLFAADGPHSFAPSHVRPRPPPAPAPPPPGFLLHDMVEAFDCNGWWSGLVVAPAPADPGSPVTVAFPITREVIAFPPNVIRPRRDFVGGEWVPSRAVVDEQQQKRCVRVYKAGEKVELLSDRKAYGDSWFPATVTKAIDRLSYIVEYNDLDGEQGGGKAAAYRYWGYIRPAEYHRPRQSKVHLCPGAAVEVYCDGAWSLGVVRRVVREGYEYEVSVDGEKAELLLTKEVYQVRPQFVWNGRHWTIPSDKRQANLRQQSASEKRPSSPVDATSSDDEHGHLKSSTAKRSRKEPQRQELISGERSEHALVSEMGVPLSESCKSLASNHSLNSCLPLSENNVCLNSCLPQSEKNGLSVFPREILIICSASKNGQPPEASNSSPNLCSLPEKNGLSGLAHKIVNACSVSTNRLLCASLENLAPPKESTHSPNLYSPLSENNGLSIVPDKILSPCSLSKSGLVCASTGDTAPPVASNNCLDLCPPLSENSGLSLLAHKTVSLCSVSKNRLLCTSSGNSAPPPDESMPNIGQTEFSRNDLSEMVPSHGQLNTPICGGNVDETCDMLSISEARKQNISSSPRNQQTQERSFPVKVFSLKKGISKNKKGGIHPKAHQGENDASNNVPIQFKENTNSSGKEIICASDASPECENSSPCTPQVSRGTRSGSDSEGVNFEKLATNEGTGLLDKELAAMINRICPTTRDEDVCTDTAATQVTKSNPLEEVPAATLDDLVQQDGSEVDERSILLPLQNAGSSEFTTDNILLRSCSFSGSSMPSDLAFSQTHGYKVPFFKKSHNAWLLIDEMDVYKKVPQQPHFRSLEKVPPAMREGMAFGLMMTFANSVEEVSKSSITDSIASFEEKITTLDHLEENGFNVQFLRSTLVRLLQIKSDHISYLTEKDQVKSQLLEKTTSLSKIDERLDKKKETIAKLEEELERSSQEAKKIVEEKEREDEELSRLIATDSSVKEACADAELQFQSVLAELRRKSLA